MTQILVFSSENAEKNSEAHPSNDARCCSLAKSSNDSSSEYSSFTSTCSSCYCSGDDGGCTECDYGMYIGKSEIKTEQRKMRKKNQSKKSTTSTKTFEKLESRENSKEKELEVPEGNKKLLENTYSSDSSDNLDCEAEQYSSKNGQKKSKNKRKKIMFSKSIEECTKSATTFESLEITDISKKSATKSSEKESSMISLPKPDSCKYDSSDTECAESSRSSTVSKKSTRNARSLSNKKISRERTTGSSESTWEICIDLTTAMKNVDVISELILNYIFYLIYSYYALYYLYAIFM